MTAAIDAKDPYTSGHSERVARIAVRLAEELGMPADKRSDLYLPGLLHDVGKIGIDDGVLKKTGPLTPEEYRKIQAHVEIGVHDPQGPARSCTTFCPACGTTTRAWTARAIRTGLAGEEIPLEARILAVADSFDAMSSNRPYRRRLSLRRSTTFSARARASSGTPRSSTPSSPAAATSKRSARRGSARA